MFTDTQFKLTITATYLLADLKTYVEHIGKKIPVGFAWGPAPVCLVHLAVMTIFAVPLEPASSLVFVVCFAIEACFESVACLIIVESAYLIKK